MNDATPTTHRHGCLPKLLIAVLGLVAVVAAGAAGITLLVQRTITPSANADLAPLRDLTNPYRIASIGDSFSSGEANPPFDRGTDGLLTGNRCHRSAQAWPRLLGVAPTAHFACSGATIATVANPGGDDTDPRSQIERLAALSPAPQVVLITIGGNEVSISTLLAHCFTLGVIEDTCYDTTDLATTERQIEALGPRLETLYRNVHDAVPDARLVVVGYPRLFPETGPIIDCGWLDTASRDNFIKAGRHLNTMITASAKNVGAEYIDVFDTLADHELCSADPHLYPVTITGAFTFFSAHPTRDGQRAIAEVVARS
jgi:lysophospholipase L1-like esterase